MPTVWTEILPSLTKWTEILPSPTIFWQINPSKFPKVKGQHLLSHAFDNFILIDDFNYQPAMKIKIITPNHANKIWVMGKFTDCEVLCIATDPLGNIYNSSYSNSGNNVVAWEVSIPDTVQDEIWTYELQVRGKNVKIRGGHIILTANGTAGWIIINPSGTQWFPILPLIPTVWTAC